MGEFTLTPWRRYGHDRIYVARGEQKVGYLDRSTGELVVEGDRDAVIAALVTAGWLAPPEPARVPDLDWAITLPGDTATYRPGASARAMAEQVRATAPVRTTLARVAGVHTDARAWRVGAEGEESVARRLAKLPASWTVVHDLPIGDRGANVDHLVVGPGGVYSLNTKNHTGRVWVSATTILHNGHRQDYLRKSRHEAARVARVLTRACGMPIDVHGVVVVIADTLTIKAQPPDVAVLSRREVRRWLAARPTVLDPELLARLTRAARDPRTWCGS